MAHALSSTLDASPTAQSRGESWVGDDSPLQSWLDWQCKMIEGVTRARLFTVKTDAGQVFADAGQAYWPVHDQVDTPQLLVYANAAAQKHATLVHKMPSVTGDNRQLECISIPLPFDNPRYVLTVLMALRQPVRHGDLAKLIQWGSHWLLENGMHDQSQLQTENGQRVDARDALAACIASQSLMEANFEFLGLLASALDCERVSIGFLEGKRIVLHAISGLPHFDRRMRQILCIEEAMEESLEQASVVDSAENSAVLINHQHRDLAARQSGYCISLPLSDANGIFGVLTLERAVPDSFGHTEIRWLEHLAALVAPALRLHKLNEAGIITRLKTSMITGFKNALSSPFDLRARSKLIAVVFVLLILLASLIFSGEYRITSNVTVEGADKQVVVAPYPGFILSASVRAGEEVEAGQVLASLDVSGLQVEKEKWLSELSKLDKSYAQSLAQGNRVELSLATALQAELSAELELVNQRIDRSQVKAPFRGVVVSGDLNQLLGAPVEQGQVLFEIASMDEFRLMLDIEEQAIAEIEEGQRATLRLASIPGITHDAVLKTLQPVAVMVDKKNVFRMEAQLLGSSEQFRPGMHGVAKIDAGERSLFRVWTHRLVNRIRLWLWYAGF